MSGESFTEQVRLFGDAGLKKKLVFLAVAFWLGAMYALYSDYNKATGTGNLSMIMFLVANIYFPAKRIRLHYRVKRAQEFFNKFLVYHIWLNTAAFGVACLHCYITLWSNKWLMLSLALMGWLTIGGFLMWIKYPPGRIKKGMYLLHTQQGAFFVMVFAMLKGHYVI